MSLGGIAIAVGAPVDAAIVVIEQRTRSSKSGRPAFLTITFDPALGKAGGRPELLCAGTLQARCCRC
jgi:hypothetical protein